MSNTALNTEALRFRALGHDRPLVLPNAWDAAGAAVMAHAGAPAIATTSGGISWSQGRSDGEGLTREQMADAVRRIVEAVDVPVTADMEGGYGPDPADVAATVRAAIDAGAVGINLEDSRPGRGLLSPEHQAARIRAGRAAAEQAGVPAFVLNARTDVFLLDAGKSAVDVAERARAYIEAGADGLFVPGLLDLRALATLAASISVPVNAMTGPGGPSVRELAEAGVRRVSVGTAIAQAAYGLVDRATRELIDTGAWSTWAPGLPYPRMNGLLIAR
ncbi:isocitrate lyase/PEP mutase family protein [Actinoplanes sp. CA-252034]|uniref:isocitrate lyase/PEP mutase family protein n=1 Tax=Actinoplanes sp. CA-252034 TaxID=3239906 RepID=UPI003D957DAD